MREYVFRYAHGYGCDMSDLMDGGRVTVGEYFASDATDHYGTLHEEIVRCRDCKHSTADGTVCWNEQFAHYEQIGDDHEWGDVPMDTEPDGFCAWGERRET